MLGPGLPTIKMWQDNFVSSVEMGRITVQSRLNEIKCAIVTLLQNMSGKSTGKKERNREEENQSIYSSYICTS